MLFVEVAGSEKAKQRKRTWNSVVKVVTFCILLFNYKAAVRRADTGKESL